jgi:hypothetical protein
MRVGEQQFWFRAVSAALVGLISMGACGAALPEAGAEGGALPRGADEADPLAKNAAADAGDGGDEAARCPHGALEDPHRGFVRCLQASERDAGWLPPPPQAEPQPPDAGVEGPGDAGPPANDAGAAPPAPQVTVPAPKEEKPAPGPPPLVAFTPPKFEGGEVPRAEKFLNGVLDGMGKCVADNGGLKADKGTLKISFLVRARGRAEGVEVASAKGIGTEAANCIRLLLKNRSVGAPSADPVGVTVTFTLEKTKP